MKNMDKADTSFNGSLKDSLEQNGSHLSESPSKLHPQTISFQKILDSIADPVFVKDENHRWVYLNESACRFWGYKREELIGKSDFQIFPREEAEVYWAMDRVVFETGETLLNEEQQTIKGKVHFISTEKSLLIDGTGARYIVGTIRDRTEYKRVETDMKESESLYRSLFELANDGIVIIQDKIVQYANPRIGRMLGVESSEIIGTPFIQYAHPDVQTEIKMLYKKRLSGIVVPTHYETALIDRNGNKIFVEVSASRIEYKRRPAILGILRDVTQRNKNEEMLRQNEHLLRQVLDSTPADIFVKDKDGIFLLVNRSSARSHGLTPEEMIGKKETELPDFCEARRNEIDRYLVDDRRVIRTKEPLFIPEEQYTMPDGSKKWLQTTKVPLTLKGKKDCVLGIAIDITERKNAEEALKESEERFLQLQKMEAIGRLAGGVAHDFNNLLTAILGYSDLLLLSRDLDQTKRYYAGEIKKVSERAARLTQQLLAFSRKQVLQMKKIGLNPLIGNLEMMLRRLIGEDITLITELDPEDIVIRADPGQVEQVIMNLAVNARDAMPGGGKLVLKTGVVYVTNQDIAEEADLSPGWFALLEVRDTGIGIDEETRQNIFEPFFTTKEIGRGTGLGLATVYGIVKQSGGFIRVDSTPGLGTSFKIFFPRIEAEEDSGILHHEKENSLHGSETVLVVEDEASVRDLIDTNLRSFGYRVIKAKNANEALCMCRNDKNTSIHLLITDIVMPGIHGRELAEDIRKLYPDIRVLFISGYTENSIFHHGELDDGITFLPKPFKMMDLARKVRTLLDG